MHCFGSSCNHQCVRQNSPTGKSKNLSSPSRKDKSLAPSGKSTVRLPPSCPTKGASAVVANAGQGAVDVRQRLTSAALVYGEIVWVRRPDAGVKFEGSQRCPRAMVSQKAGSPGRSRISRKAIARGRPECFRQTCMLMCSLFLCNTHMRPRVRRAPGLPCALFFREGQRNAKLRAHRAARTNSAVIVREGGR
jgi:hypothetical protein